MKLAQPTSPSRTAHQAWRALFALAVAMGAILFVGAGTVRYTRGWIYLVIFFMASAWTTVFLARHDPMLLERRMRAGPAAEQRPIQRRIQLGASAGFVALLLVPALDRRFGWSHVSIPATAAGDALVALGFYLIAQVYRANTYTSATIELAEGQTVVSTGPYAIVRHPMYASALLYLSGTPMALGSWWGFVGLAVMLPFLIWRIVDEERFLRENLDGYEAYTHRVRQRLLPGIW